MAKKAEYCDACEHRRWHGIKVLECAKGHKPRFYAPTGNPYFSDWGWKRRCADYELGRHVQILTPSNVGLGWCSVCRRNTESLPAPADGTCAYCYSHQIGDFKPDWANYRQGYADGVSEALDEVSQLCKDYCALNGSVFIKDVLNTLSVIKERISEPPNIKYTPEKS